MNAKPSVPPKLPDEAGFSDAAHNASESPVEPDFSVTEANIDEVLETCSGDSRAAIRALLVAQQFLHAALEEARQEASWGYVRGRPSRWVKDGQAEG